MLWKCFEQSWVSWAHSRHNFRALECGVEGNFGLFKAIVALLKTVFRPRRQATAKMGKQTLEILMNASFRIALNDRLGKTVGGGSQWGTMPCGLKPACAYVRRSLQNPEQTPKPPQNDPFLHHLQIDKVVYSRDRPP